MALKFDDRCMACGAKNEATGFELFWMYVQQSENNTFLPIRELIDTVFCQGQERVCERESWNDVQYQRIGYVGYDPRVTRKPTLGFRREYNADPNRRSAPK